MTYSDLKGKNTTYKEQINIENLIVNMEIEENGDKRRYRKNIYTQRK